MCKIVGRLFCLWLAIAQAACEMENPSKVIIEELTTETIDTSTAIPTTTTTIPTFPRQSGLRPRTSPAVSISRPRIVNSATTTIPDTTTTIFETLIPASYRKPDYQYYSPPSSQALQQGTYNLNSQLKHDLNERYPINRYQMTPYQTHQYQPNRFGTEQYQTTEHYQPKSTYDSYRDAMAQRTNAAHRHAQAMHNTPSLSTYSGADLHQTYNRQNAAFNRYSNSQLLPSSIHNINPYNPTQISQISMPSLNSNSIANLADSLRTGVIMNTPQHNQRGMLFSASSMNGPTLNGMNDQMSDGIAALTGGIISEPMGDTSGSYTHVSSHSYSYNSEDGVPVTQHFEYDTRNPAPYRMGFT